jgi:hypothetical protein
MKYAQRLIETRKFLAASAELLISSERLFFLEHSSDEQLDEKQKEQIEGLKQDLISLHEGLLEVRTKILANNPNHDPNN